MIRFVCPRDRGQSGTIILFSTFNQNVVSYHNRGTRPALSQFLSLAIRRTANYVCSSGTSCDGFWSSKKYGKRKVSKKKWCWQLHFVAIVNFLLCCWCVDLYSTNHTLSFKIVQINRIFSKSRMSLAYLPVCSLKRAPNSFLKTQASETALFRHKEREAARLENSRLFPDGYLVSRYSPRHFWPCQNEKKRSGWRAVFNGWLDG